MRVLSGKFGLALAAENLYRNWHYFCRFEERIYQLPGSYDKQKETVPEIVCKATFKGISKNS